jgi:hypothetical protein
LLVLRGQEKGTLSRLETKLWFLRCRLSDKALAGSKTSMMPSQNQRKTIGRGRRAAASLLVPTNPMPPRSSTVKAVVDRDGYLREQQQEVRKERRVGRAHATKSSAREGGRRCTCVSHKRGDATALRLRKEGDEAALRLHEGGRCDGVGPA